MKIKEHKNLDTTNLNNETIIVSENSFGKVIGYYKETVIDKLGTWVRFTPSKAKSGGVLIRAINEVRLPTNDEKTNFLKN